MSPAISESYPTIAGNFCIESTELEGAFLITPKVYKDRRGHLFERYNRRMFTEAGIDIEFVQDNQTESCRGTLRGMHYQVPPCAQAKLVYVVQGKIFDVIVDIRTESVTYGRWKGVTLSGENKTMLFVPTGFAHGFCVLSASAVVEYKCSDFYNPEAERGFRWDDPSLSIDWPVKDPILSAKDRNASTFAELGSEF